MKPTIPPQERLIEAFGAGKITKRNMLKSVIDFSREVAMREILFPTIIVEGKRLVGAGNQTVRWFLVYDEDFSIHDLFFTKRGRVRNTIRCSFDECGPSENPILMIRGPKVPETVITFPIQLFRVTEDLFRRDPIILYKVDTLKFRGEISMVLCWWRAFRAKILSEG